MVIPSRTDVLIAGGGPVGLTLALLLNRTGVKVTVVDRDAAPVEQSRAIWVHSRTLEIWDAIGMTRLASAEGRAVNGIEMHHSGHARAQLPYDGTGVSPHPNGLMLEQSRTQALLLSLIADTSIAFAWETEVASVSQRDGVCEVGVVDATGNQTTITSAFVVGADGGSSTVRKMAGITLEGGTYDSTFFLVDAMGATTLNPSHSHLNFNGRSTIAVLPLPGDGHFRIIGNMVDDDRDNAPDGGYGRTLTENEVRQLVKTNALPMSIESIGWSSTYRSHHRVANTFRRGRILLAGDAGHLHSPAGGLGMNTGIADAADLAWRVADVLAGAPDTLLDDYSSERREAARGVIRTSDRLFTLQANTHAGIAFVRRNLLPLAAKALTKTHVGRSLAFRALSGTYVSYGSGRGRRGVGALRVGHLVHLTGIPALDQAVRNPSLNHLIVRMRSGKPSFDSAPADLAARRGWEFISVDGLDASRAVGTRFPEVIVWVRPDRYVGWIGTDLEELGTILDAQIGPATRHRKTPDAD